MADKVKVVVADDAFEEFFRRAHEHARALDSGESLARQAVTIIEESGVADEDLKPVVRSKPSRIVPERRVAAARGDR
jgi:hypothetical protein